MYEEIIKDNISYDILKTDLPYDGDRLDEIVDLMLETVCTRRKTIRIAGDDYPAELVKSKFMKLDSEHIPLPLTLKGKYIKLTTLKLLQLPHNLCYGTQSHKHLSFLPGLQDLW